MLEPLDAWWLHVPELEVDPTVVLEAAFAVDVPWFKALRGLDPHRPWNSVGASASNLQRALGYEAGEHLT